MSRMVMISELEGVLGYKGVYRESEIGRRVFTPSFHHFRTVLTFVGCTRCQALEEHAVLGVGSLRSRVV